MSFVGVSRMLRVSTRPVLQRLVFPSALTVRMHCMDRLAHPGHSCRSRFSTSSVSSSTAGFPWIHNPSSETFLELLEGRVDTCVDKHLSRAMGIYDGAPPEQYYTALIRNVQLINAYLQSVDIHEFRSGAVEAGSPIARGRTALISFARISDRWMREAFSADGRDRDDLAELAECMHYFSKNLELISMYETEGPPPRPEWTDICDAVLFTFHIAYKPVEKAAGGVSEKFQIFKTKVTGPGIPHGKEGVFF